MSNTQLHEDCEKIRAAGMRFVCALEGLDNAVARYAGPNKEYEKFCLDAFNLVADETEKLRRLAILEEGVQEGDIL